jgi:hypothetical protein
MFRFPHVKTLAPSLSFPHHLFLSRTLSLPHPADERRRAVDSGTTRFVHHRPNQYAFFWYVKHESNRTTIISPRASSAWATTPTEVGITSVTPMVLWVGPQGARYDEMRKGMRVYQSFSLSLKWMEETDVLRSSAFPTYGHAYHRSLLR